MDLILWRHAEAIEPEAGQPDMARPLTRRGEKQAAKMAAWLDRQMPDSAVSGQPCHLDSRPQARKHSVHITRKWTLCKRREWRGAITALNLERKFLLLVVNRAHRSLRLQCVTG